MSVALVSSLVAGCVANDQTDSTQTGTSSQDSIVGTFCLHTDGGICPTTWTSDITATGAYWAGDGTDTPAKVMAIFYIPTKADPTTGLATAYYAWMMAGYESCSATISTTVTCTPTNSAFRVYEIAASQIGTFQAYARYNFNLHENANPLGGVWDGGVGGGLGGSPVHPGGPGGLPGSLVATMKNSMGALRNLYVNVYNANAAATR
jgi:hypothetical protein